MHMCNTIMLSRPVWRMLPLDSHMHSPCPVHANWASTGLIGHWLDVHGRVLVCGGPCVVLQGVRAAVHCSMPLHNLVSDGNCTLHIAPRYMHGHPCLTFEMSLRVCTAMSMGFFPNSSRLNHELSFRLPIRNGAYMDPILCSI